MLVQASTRANVLLGSSAAVPTTTSAANTWPGTHSPPVLEALHLEGDQLLSASQQQLQPTSPPAVRQQGQDNNRMQYISLPGQQGAVLQGGMGVGVDGGSAGTVGMTMSPPAGEVQSFERVAPCLLPEEDKVRPYCTWWVVGRTAHGVLCDVFILMYCT